MDSSEPMFATMCALYAAGFQEDVSDDTWSTFRAQIRDQARKQQGPAVDAIRAFYRRHQLRDPGATLSQFIWFGLVAGPAPNFQPQLRHDEIPPEVLALEGFSELLSNYYAEQKIGVLWRQVQPVYTQEIDRLHRSVAEVVTLTTAYLRVVLDSGDGRTFTIVVEPLVGRITNVRNYADHYAIVLSGGQEVPTSLIRHAFLHFLLDPLPLMYPHVMAVKRPLYEVAARAPRLPEPLRDDFSAWTSECSVRAVELRLRKLSPGEVEAALSVNDADGFTLVRPLYNALLGFQESAPSMKIYYPDLMRAIDVKTELARETSLTFTPAEAPDSATNLSQEQVTRKHAAHITTVPDDQQAIAELTDGEKFIAKRDPRSAEAAFRSVLDKYPDQIRAWYGLGLVALLDHDGPRAKSIFGRLTSGSTAATNDPMVLSWSHVYLGRIYGDEGELDRAKAEFQAALSVAGAPEKAQTAARNGLGELQSSPPAERP